MGIVYQQYSSEKKKEPEVEKHELHDLQEKYQELLSAYTDLQQQNETNVVKEFEAAKVLFKAEAKRLHNINA